MTRDEVITLAEESGMTQYVAAHNKYLERFALAIEARVREECAQEIERTAIGHDCNQQVYAAAIRKGVKL